jgi:hypothetical protein
MTIGPRTSSSPSRASRSSTPGSAGPQVPARIAPGGLAVPAPAVSDIPHASAIGRPSASK